MIGNWLRVLSKKTRAEVFRVARLFFTVFRLLHLLSIMCGLTSNLRWKDCEPTPLTGPRTSRTCRWISASQEKSMTPSDVAGGSATAATVTAGQLQGLTRAKKSRKRIKQIPDLTPLPLPPLQTNQGLDRKQTLRPLRPTECLKKKWQKRLKRRRLPQTPTCLSLWTTLGRTWRLLTSLRMLRAENYIWILCWIQRSLTLHAQDTLRGDATEDLSLRGPPKSETPTMTRTSAMETPTQFLIYN